MLQQNASIVFLSLSHFIQSVKCSFRKIMNKNPETIEDILKYFHGITYHGIDLSLALSNTFSIDQMYGTLHKKRKNDWLYRFLRFRFVNYFLAKRWKNNQNIDLNQVKFLLLSTGEDRVTSLSFPIFEKLKPETGLIIFTSHIPPKINSPFPSINIRDIPYDFSEMQKAVGNFWKDMQKSLSIVQNEFGFSNYRLYSIQSTLCNAVASVLRAECLLSQIKPHLVLSEFDHLNYDAIVLQIARKMNIPTATLVHGLQGGDKFSKSVWAPLIANKIIVWGEWMRDIFEEIGVPTKNIEIGGYPRIREINSDDILTTNKKLLRFNLLSNKPIVLFISTNLSDEKPATELFFNVQKNFPELNFMVRPHPRENLVWYEKNNISHQKLQNPINFTIIESLSVSDIVVGTGSGGVFDAILLSKPVILLKDKRVNYSNFPILDKCVNLNIAYYADNYDDFCKLMNRIKLNLKKKIIVPNYLYTSLGEESAKKSAQLICDYTKKAAIIR